MSRLAYAAVMHLADVRAHAERLGRIVYMSTVRPDSRPHSAPVGVAWINNEIVAFVQNPSVKVDNIRAGSLVHLHWAVSPDTNNDSLVIDGVGSLVDTAAGRSELWHEMGYDLNEFEPGGPTSDGHVFIKVKPTRATVLYRFGFDGRETWSDTELVIDLTEQPA